MKTKQERPQRAPTHAAPTAARDETASKSEWDVPVESVGLERARSRIQPQPSALGASAEASTSIAKLSASVVRCQRELTALRTDSQAETGRFSYKYASLAAVIAHVREALGRNGLAVLQLPDETRGREVEVRTVLLHESGEWVASRMRLQAADASPQRIGSAITYARRYALQSLLGIAPDDDDDCQPQAATGGDALATSQQLGEINARGTKLYGAQKWNTEKRSAGVRWATSGRAHNFAELRREEADMLLRELSSAGEETLE